LPLGCAFFFFHPSREKKEESKTVKALKLPDLTRHSKLPSVHAACLLRPHVPLNPQRLPPPSLSQISTSPAGGGALPRR